jgi:hypothetical protein
MDELDGPINKSLLYSIITDDFHNEGDQLLSAYE